ncbi:MAG: hypothetical protein AB8F95_08230 [Bacteroidia bacterium]
MKNLAISSKLLSFALAFAFMTFMTFMASGLQAQRIGLTLNANPVTSNQINGNNSSFINLEGSSNISLNLRYYTESNFAFRVGAGIENLKYSFSEGLSTDFDAKRRDMKFMAGIEWHPTKSSFIDIYPGLYIPLTFIGEEGPSADPSSPFSTGIGGVIGANIKVLKFLRFGVEYDAKYESFRSATAEAVTQGSFRPLGRINSNFNLTMGVAF